MEKTLKQQQIKTQVVNGKKKIWDLVRKKWLVYTPEEVVRQSIICFLQDQKKIPLSFVEVETGFSSKQYSTNQRTDIIVRDNYLQCWLVVECKSPDVQIDYSHEEQLLSYISHYKPLFAMLSNGKETFYWQKKINKYTSVEFMPNYSSTTKHLND